ncbi:PAS domain S-box-containing protein [Larkinella arboricola]|uniref:histidine kinase n=1 Tax=Larkinella arboricola TaxID=643671 RepID=A0A327WU63_LARAB|nr:PAS domain-containing sensor histidine kinase [Larkinella arboricola]RAJ96073.1 PAS domain S-box-containing protein [Larkinella arboricola]
MNQPTNSVERDMIAENEQLRFALQAAGVGTWDFNLVTGQVEWSRICKQLFGLLPDTQVSVTVLLSQVHPDDRERVAKANALALNPLNYEDHNIIFRTLNQEGTLRWVQAKGKTIRDEQGQLTRFSGIVQDVTQTMVAKEKLEESELFSQNVFFNSPVAKVVLIGEHFRIRTINEKMLEILGCDASVIGRPYAEVLPSLVHTSLLNPLRRVLETGETYYRPEEKVTSSRCGQSTTGYYNYTYKALYNTASEIYGIMVTATDVTQQVLVRQQLEEVQESLRSAIELAELGTWSINPTTGKTHYSDRLHGWFGSGNEDGLNTAFDPVHEKDRTRIQAAIAHALTPESGGVYRAEYTVVNKNTGQERILHSQGRTYFNEQGKPVRMVGMSQDVTQQRQLQQELAFQVEQRTQALLEAKNNLQSIMDSAPMAIMFFSPIREAGRIVDFVWVNLNKTAEELNHRSAEELIGHCMLEVTPYTQSTELFGRYVDVVETGIPFQTERELEDHGLQGWYAITAVRREDGLTLTALDISERKRAELQVKATLADLQRSNANLEQFAYVASHDLQEPLRKIQAFGDVLLAQYGPQLGGGIDYLQRMQSAASRLSVLIKDLLAFSRISTHRELNTWVSLNEVIQAVLLDLEVGISETNAQIKVAELPVIRGDASQLGQLFLNLFSNAIKFRQADTTPQIRVTCRTLANSQLPASVKPIHLSALYYLIEVTDNGIGFEQKYAERIFQVFQRLHGKSHYAGTGIGLAICARVVANHNGIIRATSEPGSGATFEIYLPVAEPSTDRIPDVG